METMDMISYDASKNKNGIATITLTQPQSLSIAGKQELLSAIRKVAENIHALLDQLGYHSFLLAGHGFGGPIAYALAAAYPKTARRLAVFECMVLLPTAKAASPAWFVTFFQTPEIPELLLKGHEWEFLKTWMRQLTVNKSAISEEDFDEYARTYALPGAVKAGAELYRAFPRDLEHNGESSKNKLTMPILAFGADNVMKYNTIQSFQAVADNVRGGIVPGCGHFVPEERPEFVVEQLLSFFGIHSLPDTIST